MYFYCQFFFAGHIIYDIGGLCQLAPPNFANILTIVQSDVRGGSKKNWARPTTQARSARTPQCAFKLASPVEKLAPELTYHQTGAWRLAPSGPKSTRNIYDSAIRCTGRLQHTLREAKTRAWSARTLQCAFKSASPVKKLAHGAQLPPKTILAHRTK